MEGRKHMTPLISVVADISTYEAFRLLSLSMFETKAVLHLKSESMESLESERME